MSYLVQSMIGTMTSLMMAQPLSVVQKNCLPPTELYERLKPSVVKLIVTTPNYKASGTGLVINESGSVVTATHVIKDATDVKVIDSVTGKSYPYLIDRVGHEASVSSVIPKGKHPKHYTLLEKSPLNPGEQVYLVGNPFEYENLFSAGYYMGTTERGGRTYLLTTALLNPGNSGGSVTDCAGNVQGFVLGADLRAEPIGILNPLQDALDLLSDAPLNTMVGGSH